MNEEQREVIKVKAAISLTAILAFLVQFAGTVYFLTAAKTSMEKDIEFNHELILRLRSKIDRLEER